MAAHLKESETEINGLLAQYWKLRHETGMSQIVLALLARYSDCETIAEVYMETLANKLGIQVSAV